MNLFLALLIILFAGTINGSFATPSRSVKNWPFENVWLQFVLWAFLIMPWVFILIVSTNIFAVYSQASTQIITIMIFGGLFFGIGQMCFAMALNTIGLGLGFVINIGIGTALGSLIPLFLQHPEELNTPFGWITFTAVALILLGLILYYFAGDLRDRQQGSSELIEKGHFKKGLILAIVAGLSSAGQNFSFAMSHAMQQIASQLGMDAFSSSGVIWPGFLALATIPYAGYMVYQLSKNKTWATYRTPGFIKNAFLVFIMAAFWYGSLLLYSKSAQLMGTKGPVVGWPLFMVLIILTSNFWGWKHHEWRDAPPKAKKILILGLIALIAAIILLGYSASYTI